MSQQEVDPSRYTRTLVVKPALSQMYDQVEVPRNGMQKTTALIRRRPVLCVYLDLGISQTEQCTNLFSTEVIYAGYFLFSSFVLHD